MQWRSSDRCPWTSIGEAGWLLGFCHSLVSERSPSAGVIVFWDEDDWASQSTFLHSTTTPGAAVLVEERCTGATFPNWANAVPRIVSAGMIPY